MKLESNRFSAFALQDRILDKLNSELGNIFEFKEVKNDKRRTLTMVQK